MKGYYVNNTPLSTLSANKWLCVVDKEGSSYQINAENYNEREPKEREEILPSMPFPKERRNILSSPFPFGEELGVA